MQKQISMNTRALISAALITLWVYTLLPQIGVVAGPYIDPNGQGFSDSDIVNLLLICLQAPAFLVTYLFRPASHYYHGTVDYLLMYLLPNTAMYMLIAFAFARAIHRKSLIGKVARFFRLGSLLVSVLALLANVVLSVWDIWLDPYLFWIFLSVSSLAIGVAAFYSCFMTGSETASQPIAG